MIRLFKNFYTDPDQLRAQELADVERRDVDHPLIDMLHPIDGWPTFAQIFQEVNAAAAEDDINVIANADIYFDQSLRLAESMEKNEAYALTRWDDIAGGLKFFDRCDSQDAWIFRGKIRQAVIEGANFTMGVRGCDNRLAALLAEAGYQVSNPSRSIRAVHLHRSGIRRYSHAAGSAVPKPYLLIDPSELGQPPNRRWIQ